MHSANIDKSERLQRVLGLLWDGKFHTTREIIRRANVCAVNSIVAELRANGFKIECHRERNKWYYKCVKPKTK